MNFFTHFLRPARRGLASLAAALVPSVAILVATFAGSHAHAAELRVGVSADITSIDPHYVNITPTNNIAFHIFGTLVAVDNDARLTPGLATEWKAIDATTWEFKLRKGVKFSDGSDFTAEDVVFSIDRIPTIKNSPGPYTSFVSRITAKEIVDAHTVRFKTATPYAMVPYDMVSVYIVSKKAATNATTDDFNSGKTAIGAGPYKLASYKRGDRVELVRNDRFGVPSLHLTKLPSAF
jgi:peptide/nickel transport system substrate-binding protein